MSLAILSYRALIITILTLVTACDVEQGTSDNSSNDFQVIISRQRGTLYYFTDDGYVENTFELSLTNKAQKDFDVVLKTDDEDVRITLPTETLHVGKDGESDALFNISIPKEHIEDGKANVEIIVYKNSKEIDRVKTKIIGPLL